MLLLAPFLVGVTWVLRFLFHSKRVSQFLAEGAFNAVGLLVFWAVVTQKARLPQVTAWAERALTPEVTLVLAIAPVAAALVFGAYKAARPNPAP